MPYAEWVSPTKVDSKFTVAHMIRMETDCRLTIRKLLAALTAIAVLVTGCGKREPETAASIGATAHDTPLTRKGKIFEFDVPRCAAFDTDGRIAICEAAEQQIVVFDSLGNHKFTFGRRGKGPGEFHSIEGVHFDDKSNLLIWDGQRSRLVTVDTSGKLISDKRIVQMTGWMSRYLGQDSSGRLAFMERTFFIPEPGDPEGVNQAWTKLFVFDTVIRIPVLIDSLVLREDFAIGRGFQRVTTGIPFSGRGDAVMAANQLVVGYSRDTVLIAHDVISGEVDTIPFPVRGYPISRGAWNSAWERKFAKPSEWTERIMAAKDKIPIPESHPRFQYLLATPRGTVTAYVPSDSTRLIYEIRCFQIAAGDICPAVRTVQGEVVLGITSGAAVVIIEQPDGSWRAVLRSIVREQDNGPDDNPELIDIPE